jgi:hypothetical protein
MGFDLGSIGAPPKEIAHLPWRERDRIEEAAHKRMHSRWGIWLGFLWGVQFTLSVVVLVLMFYSNSLEPSSRVQFFSIVFALMIAQIVSIVAAGVLSFYAGRKAFRAQLADEGLVTPSRARSEAE